MAGGDHRVPHADRAVVRRPLDVGQVLGVHSKPPHRHPVVASVDLNVVLAVFTFSDRQKTPVVGKVDPLVSVLGSLRAGRTTQSFDAAEEVRHEMVRGRGRVLRRYLEGRNDARGASE